MIKFPSLMASATHLSPHANQPRIFLCEDQMIFFFFTVRIFQNHAEFQIDIGSVMFCIAFSSPGVSDCFAFLLQR